MVDKPRGLIADESHLIASYLNLCFGVIRAGTRLNNQKISVNVITSTRNAVRGGGPACWCRPCRGCAVGIVSDEKRLFDYLLVNTNPLPCPNDGIGGLSDGIRRTLSKARERDCRKSENSKQVSHNVHVA